MIKMNFQNAICTLRELEDDVCVPKNVKVRILQVIRILETEEEPSLKVSRALHELEEITEDINMQADTRASIYNIVSILETVKS